MSHVDPGASVWAVVMKNRSARSLNLSSHNLDCIPPEAIACLTNLTKIQLKCNRLTSLPAQMSHLQLVCPALSIE
jgi:Leucine-rich repeat (LRR) protein